ncbi:MAG: hypothetical protein II903_09090 [Spirochaetales bacterium]|nr:hypothetical protein [Spirochaetales bacterium]MBQ7282492.1 hypothetical protein [Spirochaetales bacterium]
MSTSATIDGSVLGRKFEGIGGVTSNGMTKLLREYPENQRTDILNLLFTPKYGASFHQLKVEIGSDANGTCGTEPSHMRSETDFDITRGVGLWLATEAKARNQKIILDAIRWGTPSWITDNTKKYLYYKNFLQGAKDEFNLDFDFLSPDENEGDFSRNWVVNVLRPGLDNDGFSNVKLTGADSTTDWNIASMVNSDSALKASLYAINAHYKQDSPDAAKNCGLPIFDSEDVVAYRHKFSSALDMAYKIIRSYASGRMVQYVMHPIIEAIYDNVPYTYKGIIEAAHPWTGHYKIEPALWVVAQFTQFIEPGWYYINSGCHTASEHSYLTLKDSSTGDFSIVLLNRSATAETFNLTLNNLQATSLHAWQTTEASQFINLADVPVNSGALSVTLPPYSICTLTTTTGQSKGQPAYSIPSSTSFSLPYNDDFESYSIGKQPRYTVDQSGAYEIASGGKNGGNCLKQVIKYSNKPIDWERRATPSPYTILGGQELKNYKVSFDFLMETITDADYEGYVLLGARCNFSPTGNVPAECYNIRLFHDGRWQLRSAALVLQSGMLSSFTLNTWHSLQLCCRDNVIQVYYDNQLLTETTDSEYPSGHVVIGSGYNIVRYDNLAIEQMDASTPVECERYKELDSRIEYIGSWAESGSNAKNYHRTLLTTSTSGDEMDFSFNGTSVSILGVKDVDCGLADVYIDGSLVETIDSYADSTKYRKSLFSAYGLNAADHHVRLVVKGSHSTDSTGNAINIDAVETIGGTGLIDPVHTPISTDIEQDVTLYESDFSTETTGNKPYGWSVTEASSTQCRIALEDTTKCITLNDQASSGVCYAIRNFAASSDRLNISFEYKTASTGKWFRLYALDGTSSVVEIYDSNVNGLCYRNRNASDVKIMDISAGNWYKIDLQIDISNNLFSVQVNDTFKKTGCTFRRQGSKIDGIRIESGSSFKGQAWFRNFRIGKYSLAEDMFDMQTVNTQPVDWSLVAPTGTTVLIETADIGNCVSLSDSNTSQQASMTKYFPAQTGTVILSLKLSESGLGTWSRILLSDGSTNAIEIYNSDLYNLCYRANDGSYVNFLTPVPGTWYELMVVADVNAKRFDIYVDGTRIKTACTFRNVVSSISQIRLATGESYTGTTRFKNISVRKGIS